MYRSAWPGCAGGACVKAGRYGGARCGAGARAAGEEGPQGPLCGSARLGRQFCVLGITACPMPSCRLSFRVCMSMVALRAQIYWMHCRGLGRWRLLLFCFISLSGCKCTSRHGCYISLRVLLELQVVPCTGCAHSRLTFPVNPKKNPTASNACRAFCSKSSSSSNRSNQYCGNFQAYFLPRLRYMGTAFQLDCDLCFCRMQRTAPLCSCPSTSVMSHSVRNRQVLLMRPCCAVAARSGTLPDVASPSSYLTGGQEGPERQRLFDRIAPVYDQVCSTGSC